MCFKEDVIHFLRVTATKVSNYQVSSKFLECSMLRLPWLTPSSRVLLEKLTVSVRSSSQEIPKPNFFKVFIRTRQRCLFRTRWIQCTHSHAISVRSILILSSQICPDLPSVLLPSSLPTKVLYTFLVLFALYIPVRSRSTLFYWLIDSFIHSFIFCRSHLEHRPPFRVSVITRTIRHTVGLHWTSDQPVAETSTYTGQHNI
jgi:hypothetical protein